MAASSQLIGQTLGHYRIIEQIGAGGMGVVYRAHDEQLERDVAIKVLPVGTPADDVARKRFRKEALALAKLNHPNIATIFEFGSQNSTDYLVTEYIFGQTLDEKLATGALSEKEVCCWAWRPIRPPISGGWARPRSCPAEQLLPPSGRKRRRRRLITRQVPPCGKASLATLPKPANGLGPLQQIGTIPGSQSLIRFRFSRMDTKWRPRIVRRPEPTSMMPIPNGPTLFVSEYERVVSFYHFPRENEIGSVLLHLRADEGEFIPFAKPYTHVVEERLRAEIYVDGVRAIFHEQMHDLFLSAFRWQLHFLNGPLEFGFGVKVILGRACCGWLAFLGLCRCPEKNHEKHQQEDNLAGKV